MSGCSAIGSALALGARGCQFESGHPDHFYCGVNSMQTRRIFFLLTLFIMSSSFFTQTSELHNPLIDNNNYPAEWKRSYVDSMSAPEKQMLANILLSLFCNAIAEQKTRQFSTPIARLNQAIRIKIGQYSNPDDDIAMLKTLLERLSFVANTRTIYLQTYNTCAIHYNKNIIPLIEQAVEGLQLYAQDILRNWANEKTDETHVILRKSSDIIGDTVQHFQGISRLHRGMSDGALPIQIGPEDEANKSLIPLHIILNNNPELYSVNDTLVNALNETTDHATQVVHAGMEIYKQFYTILYNDLTSPSCDQRYATTLFSMHGLLPEEYISFLPHPDHVFEHMLQTTKLYTQTEFLPS
jgi:hypothetical protein